MAGRGFYSPFAARELARALIRGGRRRGPVVTAVLEDPEPGIYSIQFANEGSETAGEVSYYLAGDHEHTEGQISHLAPGASESVPVRIGVDRNATDCIWTCLDRAGRLNIWSYDGRRKRLGRGTTADSEESFRLMYPDRV